MGEHAGGTAWFDDARLGVFVHWGHTSQQGIELSWPLAGGTAVGGMSCAAVPIDRYHASAATFSPRPGAMARIVEQAAAAGARYAVFTTKHHDGFAMWPSALTDWTIAHTPYDGDLVAEFVDACRRHDLRVGLYHSLSDWHHPDYPALSEADLPYAYIAYRRADPDAWARYLEVLHGQVRELLTDYGRIDVLWFDGQWERTPQEWRAAELREMIRELQPDCLVNDRLPVPADFDTPEQFLPPEPPGGRWEMCLTMGHSWAYQPDDRYQSASRLVHTLAEVAGKGGNLLLNVGPDGDGDVPPPQAERLGAIGSWMARNGEAIIGTEPGLAPWQWYGPSTRRGDRVYLVCVARPYESVTVRGVPVRRVERVSHLATGTDLAFTSRLSVIDELINADPLGELTIVLGDDLIDPLATVVAVDIAPGR
ncbi:MAG: alpha-L-fucosidase [Desertimonas sp.]